MKKKKKNNSYRVTRVRYLKNSLIMTTKKLEIIVTKLVNLEAQVIRVVMAVKVPVIFHDLRGYDSHLVFCELNKFDVKIDVIPNRLKNYMVFF